MDTWNGFFPQPESTGRKDKKCSQTLDSDSFFMDTGLAMFFGSFVFWVIGRIWPKPAQRPNEIFVQNQESICAGVIAGAALIGVALMALEVFVLGM